MSSFAAALNQEITRLARKEVKAGVDGLRRANVQYRRDIAELKRTVKELERRIAGMEKEEKKRLGKPAKPEASDSSRFSPRWVKTHREKIGLSQADYARLVGVSAVTIYNWESGRTRPREEQLAALSAIRKLGKREAERQLEVVG